MSDDYSSMPVRLDQGSINVTLMGNLTKREYFAFEFAKYFVKEGWDKPLASAVEYADILIAKLEPPKPEVGYRSEKLST